MAKAEALTVLQFINRVEFDRKTGAYRYTVRPVNKEKRNKPIQEYEGYLWVAPHYYAKRIVDELYAPFMGTTLTYPEYEAWLSPEPGFYRVPEELKDLHPGSLLYAYQTAQGMPGMLHPPAALMPRIEKARDNAIIAEFLRRKKEKEENEAHNAAPDSSSYKVVKPIHKIIGEIAADYTITPSIVRNVLSAARVLHGDLIEIKHRPTTRMPPEHRFFRESFRKIRAEGNAYYTGGGFGAKNIARSGLPRGFLTDLTKMVPGLDGEYEAPLDCQITWQYFNDESLRNPANKKHHSWNDIVIGRCDVNKPAHYENLTFMTRLARDIIEMQYKYTSRSKKPWEKLGCTQDEWEQAMEKTEYGIKKYMEAKGW